MKNENSLCRQYSLNSKASKIEQIWCNNFISLIREILLGKFNFLNPQNQTTYADKMLIPRFAMICKGSK